MKYRKKPEIVEAIKFLLPNELRDFCPKAVVVMNASRWAARIPTGPWSVTEAREGDYVLKNALGEFKVMPARVFEAFYEPAT